MFEIKGFAFIHITDTEIKQAPLSKGLYVDSWEEAHSLLQANGVKHYIIMLKEVK